MYGYYLGIESKKSRFPTKVYENILRRVYGADSQSIPNNH